LIMPAAMTWSAGSQLTVQADQLLLQQGQGLGHTDEHPVERPSRHLMGGDEAHAVLALAVERQVPQQGHVAQMRVPAAGHVAVGRKASAEGAEAIVQHQHAGIDAQPLRMHVAEQVLVGGVEGLQGLVGDLGLAEQLDPGEGRVEDGTSSITTASRLRGRLVYPPAL
jgi:hypothetical protein